MYRVVIRFYEELNDLISKEKRKSDIEFSFSGRRSIKDLIESFGVPHVEVDLILVNQASVDFSYIVRDGDRISVYPVFETFPIDGVTRLRASPLRNLRFVFDVHLRKLARRMRLLGFDVYYEDGIEDSELVRISYQEKRILLTRDRQLLMRRSVSRGLYIRNTDPNRQMLEIVNRLHLRSLCKPFTRCIECNGEIRDLLLDGDDFKERMHRIPEGVLLWCIEFSQCASCDRIYWKGSHYEKLRAIVDSIINAE
ncbi:MAG: Mut7-C RNAse domain-containing protein [Spirochaetota bacterium]|nr:Mut7-C RNAse domain-containing protein [Spirochaetota bacterium]